MKQSRTWSNTLIQPSTAKQYHIRSFLLMVIIKEYKIWVHAVENYQQGGCNVAEAK